MFQATKQAMSLTQAAADQIKTLMEGSADPVIGLRVGIKTTGCSGMSYAMEYATEIRDHEEVVEDKGVKIIIDPKSIMFLIGTEMDYVTDRFGAHFTFNNPNEAGRCGCGESFHVEKKEDTPEP